MHPAYYEDFVEIKNKIWSMLDNAIKDRTSPFRIPVFICGNENDGQYNEPKENEE